MRRDSLRHGTPVPPPPVPVEKPDPALVDMIMKKHNVPRSELIKVFPDGSYNINGDLPEVYDRENRLYERPEGKFRVGYDD